jgi:hypothetical protein
MGEAEAAAGGSWLSPEDVNHLDPFPGEAKVLGMPGNSAAGRYLGCSSVLRVPCSFRYTFSTVARSSMFDETAEKERGGNKVKPAGGWPGNLRLRSVAHWARRSTTLVSCRKGKETKKKKKKIVGKFFSIPVI